MPRKVHRASIQALRDNGDKREQQTHNELISALNRLVDNKPIRLKKGTKISITSVANEAGVSRTSVYNHEDILTQIKKIIEKKSISPAQARRLSKEEKIKKENEKKELINQLNIDKSNLAQENFKLSLQNKELNELLESKEKDIAALIQKLGTQKITLVK